MASARHVTLRDIATAARMDVSTVSLALHDNPRLRLSTRQRIQRLARRLGYAADPLSGALAKYRQVAHPPIERPKIAWVTNHPTANGWKKLKTAQQSFLGAQACAQALGYELEVLWLGAAGMTAARAGRILRGKNAMGLLIAPAAKPNPHLRLPWNDFPAVAIGLSLVSPVLHLTANHHYRSARLAVRRLIQRGYQRIGLVLRARAHERVEHGWLGGYLVTAVAGLEAAAIPPLILPRWDARLIRQWYRRHQPDAIITRHSELAATLAGIGVIAPDNVGLAILSVSDRSGDFAGVDENAHAVGFGAMAKVADMITRGEKGIPDFPQRLLFEGAWVEGRTVRPPAGRWEKRATTDGHR